MFNKRSTAFQFINGSDSTLFSVPSRPNRPGLLGLSLALIFLSTISLAAFAAQVSRFCPECADSSTASQKATLFTPPVRCDWPNGSPELPIPDDLVCHSSDLDVLLVNPLTGELFAYRLQFDSQLNRHVLQTRVMSLDEQEAARTTVEIYQELMTADFGGTADAQSVIQSSTPGIQNSMECPDEPTALDHVLNPELRQWMIDELRDPWFRILGQFNNRNSGVSRTRGISASVGPVTLSTGWSSSPPPLDDVFFAGFGFNVSEVPVDSIVNGNIITFRINDVRYIDNRLVVDSEFAPGLSRAAGVAVNNLLSGQTVVDNQCVIDKLAEYDDNNPEIEFREGGPGGSLFDFPDTSGSSGSDLCTKRVCATVCIDGNCSCQFEVVVLTLC